jgi:uncharacterized membrane protein YqhA
MNRIERTVEAIVFNSRWLVALFLLGLIVGLAALAYKFLIKLAWVVGILIAFAAAMLVLAIADRVSNSGENSGR